MQRERLPNLESATGVDPGRAAICVLLVFVCLCAYMVRTAADSAIDSLQNGEAMVFFRTPNGIQSDSQDAEHKLALSSNGLAVARKTSQVLFLGSSLVAIALVFNLSNRRPRSKNR